MIDLHSHILPGVDDGSKSLDESLTMVKFLGRLGFQTVFATPHQIEGGWCPDIQTMNTKLDEVRSSSSKIYNGSLLLGAEHHFDVQFMERVQGQKVTTIGNSRVLLVELPEGTQGSLAESYLEKITNLARKNHFQPMIAHPERIPLDQAVGTFSHLKNSGCLLQLDLLSICKNGRGSTRERAFSLLSEGLYDGLGSDLHNATSAAFSGLEEALANLKNKISTDYFYQLANAKALGFNEPKAKSLTN